MAQTKLRSVETKTIEHRVIVCSVCGTESPYKSPSQIKQWEGREWFCKKHRPVDPRNKQFRNQQMFEAIQSGKPLSQVAAEFKVTRARVTEIVNRI